MARTLRKGTVETLVRSCGLHMRGLATPTSLCAQKLSIADQPGSIM
jgi:hypothetical protein